MPGPLTKNANTSLKTEPIHCKYSSEANTKLNAATLDDGTKSNSKITASLVLNIAGFSD